ncbi:hypothetical protein KCU77_g7320, partial [Aureobasidium melanogenum]
MCILATKDDRLPHSGDSIFVLKVLDRIRGGDYSDPLKSYTPKGPLRDAAVPSMELLDIQAQLFDTAINKRSKAFTTVDPEHPEILTNHALDKIVKLYGDEKNEKNVQKCVDAAWKYIDKHTKVGKQQEVKVDPYIEDDDGQVDVEVEEDNQDNRTSLWTMPLYTKVLCILIVEGDRLLHSGGSISM